MINSDANNGGIYRAFILSEAANSDDCRIYIPCLISDSKECPVTSSGTMNMLVYQKCKDIYPKPLWCLPNKEAKKYEPPHPCWVIFENGDIKKPIIMGFLGKGIKYSAGSSGGGGSSGASTSVNNNSSGGTNANLTSYNQNGLTISSSGFAWPTPGFRNIFSGYRTPSRPNHEGIDISEGGINNTPIVATKDGVVTVNQYNSGGYGYWVEIKHDNGIYSRYGHMISQSSVAVGSNVKQGDVIGYVGSTGRSQGPHLHFEIRPSGVADNPMNYVVQP